MKALPYFEQALALDPRNVEALVDCGIDLRRCFDNSPPALKRYDRALDVTPNDPDVMGSKAWHSSSRRRATCKKPPVTLPEIRRDRLLSDGRTAF